MENRIAMLEEDLKNARNMIDCLNRTVEMITKIEKPATNDDISSKLDLMLQKMVNQEKQIEILTSKNDEMQGKLVDAVEQNKSILKTMDNIQVELDKSQGYIAHFVESHGKMDEKLKELTDKVEHVMEDTKNLVKLEKIVDTVDTTQGYVELFVKDFEKIHAKMEDIDDSVGRAGDKMENALESEHISENFGKIRYNLDQLSIDICKIHTKIEKNEEGIELLKRQIEEVSEKDIKPKFTSIDNILSGIKGDLGFQKSNCGNSLTILQKLDKDMLPKVKEISEKVGGIFIGPIYKCPTCKSVLPFEPLREDGVSVFCKCNIAVNIGKLKTGHKWTTVVPEGKTAWCGHYQQMLTGIKYGEDKTCDFCGIKGKTQYLPPALCIYDGK